MGKINKVKEGDFLFSVREDGQKICIECRYNKSCYEKDRVEKMVEEGMIVKVMACSSYDDGATSEKKFFGDLK